MNPLNLMQPLSDDVMYWHNKGLSQFGIAQKLKIPSWTAKEVIEEELKQDYDSLFRGS